MNTSEVKKRLQAEGRTIKAWAESKGITDYALVCQLMNGVRKGIRGKGHAAAVALGLKPRPNTGES
ncbi:MAG: DNA-binding protein [Zoogloeaceae bacterium]|jgi:gp16 family phage-associated protein|nr:DNA-binding protein [Zoogloeaceae bacterium]